MTAQQLLTEHQPKALDVDVLGCTRCEWSHRDGPWKEAFAAHQVAVLAAAGHLDSP